MNLFFKELRASIKKELLPVGNFEATIIDPSLYTTPDGGAWTFDTSGGNYNYFKFTGYDSCVEAYNRCPILSAIIGQQAQAFVNGKIKFVDEDGDEIKSHPEMTKLKKLFKRPNVIQSFKTFEAHAYSYVKLFGFAIILAVKPAGFKKRIDASSLWNIPPNWIDWTATNERFNELGGIALSQIVIYYNGFRTLLNVEDLIIIRDFTPQLADSGSALTFPQSKVNSNSMFINNIIGALESRNTLINYRGAMGILSQDTSSSQYVPLAMTDPEKEQLQKDFRQYGLRRNQWQVILTSAALKWQQMGRPTKDLMLLEEVEQSSLGLCASWNFPAFILGFKDATFHNMSEAEKHLYENCTKPDSDSFYEQFTDGLGASINITKDFSHVAPLQEDKLEAAGSRFAMNRALEIEWKNGKITLNQWAEKLGEEKLKDARGEMYYPEYTAQFGTAPKQLEATQPQEGKMFTSRQMRDENGRYTALFNYIFDNTTPNGQEI